MLNSTCPKLNSASSLARPPTPQRFIVSPTILVENPEVPSAWLSSRASINTPPRSMLAAFRHPLKDYGASESSIHYHLMDQRGNDLRNSLCHHGEHPVIVCACAHGCLSCTDSLQTVTAAGGQVRTGGTLLTWSFGPFCLQIIILQRIVLKYYSYSFKFKSMWIPLYTQSELFWKMSSYINKNIKIQNWLSLSQGQKNIYIDPFLSKPQSESGN